MDQFNRKNNPHYVQQVTQLRVKADWKREVEGELRPHAHMRDLRDSEGYKENVEGHEVVARDALTTLQEEPRDYPIATQ